MNALKKILGWMPQLLAGARITILLTLCAVCAGILLGIFIALGKMSKRKWVRSICSAYTFFFRGTPLLMQISRSLTINNQFLAAFIAYSLNSAAYCSEIIRAAIQSIDKGQSEAAEVLGMNYFQTMRLVILPQSIKRLVPPIGNEFIMLLKDASLVSLIALADITKVTRSIQSSTTSSLVYIPAMILYLVITAVFTLFFRRLEKRHSVYE